ncbi:hypothetical protein PRIPAC_89204 [Pristionchus pacificus]|uniref:Uncharacterized protein n=1 Tax=Pristionchus pacificus TaxID=54126 RepID=A0A2A6CJB5_PRIPA|nr:hypothetical protein PRIPAC_89204 [Pristionchus pacificus]|eukprot:PDM78133.1 hypothetical protein PRIPAC_30518 [Pristionchus pacificus]
MQEQFRVILLSDGLVHSSQNRVAKLCDGVVSFKSSSLLDTTIELPNRDMYVFDPASDKIIQLKDHDYETITCSRITDVNLETEPSLTLVQLNKQVKDTAWLINHFIDQEISSSNRNSSFTFVVFTASNKVLVSDMAEGAFILDNVSIVIDMGLTSWKSNVTSIGSNHIRTIWADRIRRIRRAKIVEKGIVAYPFDNKMLQCITSRSISKFPGYDLEMARLIYRLNEERTNELMRRAENILCTAGLISYKDRRYCTPLGSFCNSVLPMLSPRMAKLVLCGIVCGCEDAAVALATILTEEAGKLPFAIDCSKNMYRLLGMVKVQIRSEHLACLHAYDSRFGPTKSLFPNYGTIQNMEKKEQLIRMRIQKDGKAGVGVFENDEETEKRLLLALAMAFGDRIGYASKGDEKGETRLFSINDPDNGDTQFQMQTEFHSWSTAEVTMLPVTILGAIGNIGGRAVKSTEGLYLTTNTGPLHVKMMEYDDVDEMLDIRNEVMMEVQRVALTYLNTDRYSIIFKKERDNWMNELIPLLTPHSPS